MTNVAKHSGATRCMIEIGLHGELELTVTDDGRGTRASRARAWAGRR